MGFIAPRLPENAPFSPLQRAWLDGFLAGLFGNGNSVDARTIEVPAAAKQPEDFPWHDPGLPLDERVALAAGRRPERVLMAAMAQTDCGQCGYLCQTYAEAIASAPRQASAAACPAAKRPRAG